MAKKWILGGLLGFFFWACSCKAFFLTAVQKGEGYALKGQLVKWIIFRCEPFQGRLYDLKLPKAELYPLGGKPLPVSLRRIKLEDLDTGKKRYAYQAQAVLEEEGDYFLVLSSEPTLVPGTTEVWQEFVKVPLHLGREGAWDQPLGLPLEIIPLTRPYGLRSDVPFTGVVLFQGRPLPKVKVQVVPFHGVFISSKALPQDPWGQVDYPLMYQSTFTDQKGEFVVGFTQEGWWLISAAVHVGNHRLGGRAYPLFLRINFWLYVRPGYKVPEKAPRLRFP